MYRVCINDPFKNCDKIYPMAQKKVKKLLDIMIPQENPNIQKIIIFGSAVSDRFSVDSDIDIYVELQKEEKLIKEYIPFEFDLWTNFQTDTDLEKEIKREGVIVYESTYKEL